MGQGLAGAMARQEARPRNFFTPSLSHGAHGERAAAGRMSGLQPMEQE